MKDKKTLKNLILLLFFVVSLDSSTKNLQAADEIGDYIINKTYTINQDGTSVSYWLTQDPLENAPTFHMKTTLEATPGDVFAVIRRYGEYVDIGMPRQTESTFLHTYGNASIDLVMGKEHPRFVSMQSALVVIARFAADVDYLPADNNYTQLLASDYNTATGVYRTVWIQYDKPNYDNISGPWKATAPIPYEERWTPLPLPGYKLLQKSKYINDNSDMYGSWTLTPVGEDQTLVEYEMYVDPGWAGRQLMGQIVNACIEDIPKIITVIENQLEG